MGRTNASRYVPGRPGERLMVYALRRLAPAFVLAFAVFVALSQVRSLDSMFDGVVGFDFRGTIYEPARAVVDGVSPYPRLTDRAVIESGNPAVYPPVAILAATPLTQLHVQAAYAIWTLVLVAAVVGALLLAGVRDWRCHALALLSPPVIQALYVGNVTLLLMVSLAIAWRWRRRGVSAGVVLGVGIAIKPIAIPLLGWLILTRRWLAAGVAVASSVLLAVTTWALIGFDGFREYPRLLDRIEEVYGLGSYSLPSALWEVAADGEIRHTICLGAGLVLFGIAAALRNSRSGDLVVFSIMVGACVVASPVVWPHYVALLLVPLGVACPRFAPLWMAPYALPIVLQLDGRTARALAFLMLVLLLTAATVIAARRPPRRLAS